jgi:hypothetical protein
MNSKQSKVLIRKYTRNDYETRFLLQSKNHSPNRINSPKMNSRVVQWLGGEESFDFLSIYFAGLIAEDDILAEVYRGLNAKTLVKMQKELLQLALDDGLNELISGSRRAVYNQTILQRHSRLGLMERDEYFDRLAYHLTYALVACQINDTDAIFKIQRRFAAILEISLENMELHQSKRMKSNRFPSLRKLIVSKKTKVRCSGELQPGTRCPVVTATVSS